MCLCKIVIGGSVIHTLQGYRGTMQVVHFWTGSTVF